MQCRARSSATWVPCTSVCNLSFRFSMVLTSCRLTSNVLASLTRDTDLKCTLCLLFVTFSVCVTLSLKRIQHPSYWSSFSSSAQSEQKSHGSQMGLAQFQLLCSWPPASGELHCSSGITTFPPSREHAFLTQGANWFLSRQNWVFAVKRQSPSSVSDGFKESYTVNIAFNL